MITALAVRVTRLGHTAVAALLGVAIVVLTGGIWPLLAVAVYLGASLSLGHLLLNLRCGRETAAGVVHTILVGAGLYATLVGFSVHFQVNYLPVYLVALAVPMVFARRHLLETIRTVLQQLRERTDDQRGGAERPLLGALILLYLAMACLPELSYDPLAMHLFVPAYVAANQAWNFDPNLYIWTFMPMLADWSYTIAYVLAGETAARLVNVGFLFVATFFVREFVQSLGGSRQGADWAALLLLSTPLTLLVGGSLYVEAFWSACLLGGTIWIFRAVYDAESCPSGMLHGGIVLGFAAAAKAVVLPYLPLLALPVLHRFNLLRSRAFRVSSLKGAAAFLVLAAWPYALACIKTGNPVFPFYNSLFQSPYHSPVDFDNSLFNAELSWNLPYLLVFAAEQFGGGRVGGAGFQWLTLAIPACAAVLLFRLGRAAVLLVIATTSLVLIFQFQSFLRYVFPVILFTCVLVGLAVSYCASRHRTLGAAMAVLAGLTILLNLLFLGSATPKYRDVPVLNLFLPDGAEQLEGARAPVRKAVRLLNLVNEHRLPVAFLSEPTAAELRSEALFATWYNQQFRAAIGAVTDAPSFAEVLRRYRGRYLIFDSRRGGNDAKIAGFVTATADLLGRFGPVAAYRVADEWFFAEELLQSPNDLAASPWRRSSIVERLENGAMLVTGGSRLVQDVAVREGEVYLNGIKARCGDRIGRGRLQVTWHDAAGGMLKTDVTVFDCPQNWSRQIQEVAAPEGAITARVFGLGHGQTPVEISGLSFRGIGANQIDR